jgi:dolichol-phosphate mannosyltransferase
MLAGACSVLLALLLALQLALACRVARRLLRTAGGPRIATSTAPAALRVSVLVPVLNEERRLRTCLAGAIAQPREVIEILVIDGGSHDGTRAVVAECAAVDPRVRLVDASPVPADWTGKAWGLECGLRATAADVDAVLCLDADVRAAPALSRSLLAHLRQSGVAALSVATRQRLASAADALLHPSLLATLVYRFGIPGTATARPGRVQANGQCFIAWREPLRRCNAVRAAQGSLCEDVTIARCLAAAGERVGFYEAGDLVEAQMYEGWREAWRNWPRSLPMCDQYFGAPEALGLVEVALVQAGAVPAALLALAMAAPVWAIAAASAMVALRAGVLIGMARAYTARPWTYWLSPLTDLPVAGALLWSVLHPRHRWRGRGYIRTGHGRFRVQEEALS